jgi:hypothetical protein
MGVKWTEASAPAKIASIGMALSSILTICIGFSIIEELPIPEFLGDIAGIYVLLFFAIDVIVTIGLFFTQRWARRLTIYWGVLSILSVIPSFLGGGGFSVWFVPNLITLLSAIFLLGAGKDFSKNT